MRIFKRIFMILISIIIILFLIFFTPDLPEAKLMDDYYTDASHQITLEITSLTGETLDIDLHYQDYGSSNSPVILLIHGAFSSSHTFIPWAEDLVQEGYRVILPDLPYFGLSSGFEDHITSFRRSAAVMKALLDELDIDKVHIGGNSLGGAASWFFASEYPESTESLLLIDALPPDLDNRRDVSDFLRSPFVSRIVSQMTPQFLVNSLLKTAYGNPDLLTKDLKNRYFDLLRRNNTRQWILQTIQEQEPNWSYQDRLASIDQPTLLMWGMKDTWITPDQMNIFIDAINIPDDRVLTYDALGHVPMEEDPTTVEDYILFLNSL